MPILGRDTGNGTAAWAPLVVWAMSTSYVVGPPASVVTYQGETYVAIVSHTSTSEFDPTKWLKVAAKGADGNDTGANHIVGVGIAKLTVGTTFPTSPTVGDVFIQRS